MYSYYEYILSYQNQLQLSREVVHNLEKFIAYKPEKEVISLRIPTEILKDIDNKSTAIGISRNELINQMIVYALSNMEETLSK